MSIPTMLHCTPLQLFTRNECDWNYLCAQHTVLTTIKFITGIYAINLQLKKSKGPKMFLKATHINVKSSNIQKINFKIWEFQSVKC